MHKLFMCGMLLISLAGWPAFCASLTVPVDNAYTSRLLLPITNNTLPVNASVSLRSEAGPVQAELHYRLLWPGESDAGFVRLLVIDLEAPPAFSTLTLSWEHAADPLRPFWGKLGNAALVSPNRIWLQKVVMLQAVSVPGQEWYTDAQRLHANYIADDKQMQSHKYPLTRASHWLYDKPQSFFQLFLMTGDDWALIQALRLAEFYAEQIKDNGYFGLRNRKDIKYVMSRGLTYHFLLTGSEQMKDTVARQFEASLDWDPEYDTWRGFWTERNQAAALNTAIAQWELTGSSAAKERIDAIIDATYKMTFEPVDDWDVRNCPLHTMESHEGKGGDRPVCSPWMMALLADGLWRMVMLNDDWQAAELLRAFGRFFADYGVYAKEKRGETVVAPYYLRAFPDHDWIEKNIWTDPQHNCEIAGMLGKSVMIYGGANRAPDTVLDSFRQFSSLCRQKLSSIAEKNTKKSRDTAVRLKPPRRFGWMYSSTGELPWLMRTILSDTE